MRVQSLKKNKDFQRVYRKGKNCVCPHVVLYYTKNREQETRLGLTCSKKVGNAVIRNRARRVMRNAFIEAAPLGVGAYDVVFVARGRTPELKTHQLAVIIQRLLREEKLLSPVGKN